MVFENSTGIVTLIKTKTIVSLREVLVSDLPVFLNTKVIPQLHAQRKEGGLLSGL